MIVSIASHVAMAAVLLFPQAQKKLPMDDLINDARSQPESLTLAPGGVLIVGSASSPYVYRLKPGAEAAEKFIDASAEGQSTFFFGMLADAGSNTLWACQLTPEPGATPPKRHTALRGFDLTTGAPKLRWDLPGETSTCNDMTLGPDKALYISDTANASIFRLPAGGTTASLLLSDPMLKGIDGLTFLNGTLYVNSVSANRIFRVPLDKAGKAGTPVEIAVDQPLSSPDGMRAANGKLYVAEGRGGRVSELTLDGDKATVKVLKDGLKNPTAVEPAGDTLWITERGAGMVHAIGLTK